MNELVFDLATSRGTMVRPPAAAAPYLEAIARAGYRGSASVELEFPPTGVPIREWVSEARDATAGLLVESRLR